VTKADVFDTLVIELKRGLAEITSDLALLRSRLQDKHIGTEKYVELAETLREQEHRKLQMLERLYHPESTRWDKIREE
jgi:hypothetical protein